MPVLDYLKRAFGFSHDQDDDEYPETPTGYRRSDDPAGKSPTERRADTARSFEDAPASEIEKLKASLAKATDDCEAAKRAQLSAERQKRALSDRVYDLEEKLSTALDERDKFCEESQRLNAQLKVAAKGQSASNAAAVGADPRDAEIEQLRKDLEAVTLKCSVADAMVADLTSKASQSKRDKAKNEADSSKLKEDIGQLKSSLSAKEAELKEVKSDLEEAEKELKAAESIAQQVQKFESVLSKKDMRIAELQRALGMREKEITSLNLTIEHNLRRHAEAEELMRREIQKLRSGYPSAARPAAENPAADADANAAAEKSASPADDRRPKPRRHGRRRNNDNNDNQLSLF